MNNPHMEATTLNNLATLSHACGELMQARAYLDEALALHRATGNLAEAGSVLNNLGAICSSQGEIEEALVYYEQALLVRRESEDYPGLARTLYNLAVLLAGLGDLARAEALLVEAVQLDEALGLLYLERDTTSLRRVRERLEGPSDLP